MFFYKVEGHMPKLSSFGRGKKFRPKKSLTSLLHAALQFISATKKNKKNKNNNGGPCFQVDGPITGRVFIQEGLFITGIFFFYSLMDL